jgi:hypothetical protein
MFTVEPPLGLPNYFISQATPIPNKDVVDAFYQNHAPSNCIPSQTLAAGLTTYPVQHMTFLPMSLAAGPTAYPVQYMTFLPMPMVPAFINGMQPNNALGRIKEIIQLLPAVIHGRFEYLIH